ncbi:MAG: hypothetical protein ACREBD_33675 [Blastocatellia bacterium]
MRFEYQTTFVPVVYLIEEKGDWLFKEADSPHEPIVESLTGNPAYEQHLKRMGNEGWELVSVQSLLKGVVKMYPTTGMGYSLTAGYYLFWKREIVENL